MEELTNIRRSEDFEHSKSYLTTSSAEKSTHGTYDLLRKQENILSQFENNLQKTMSLLHNQSPTAIRTDEDTSNLISHNSPFVAHTRESYRYGDPKLNLLEKENMNLKLEIRELENENAILKRDLNNLKLHQRTNSFENMTQRLMDIEELKQKNKMLNAENEELRAELKKVKAEYYMKYENLQKNNDELLLSYEERYKQKLENLTLKYEEEIQQLKAELMTLEELQKKTDEHYLKQKEKYELAKRQLEQENADLMARLNQLEIQQGAISFSRNSFRKESLNTSSAPIVDELLKEKHEIETRYHDLFTSYSHLLEHNRNLARKLEQYENDSKEMSRMSRKTHLESNKKLPKRIDSSTGRIVKNKENKPSKANYSAQSDDEKLINEHLRKSELYDPITMESNLKPKMSNEDLETGKYVSNFEEGLKPILKHKEDKTPRKRSLSPDQDAPKQNKRLSTKSKKKPKTAVQVKDLVKEYELDRPNSARAKKMLKTNTSKESIKQSTLMSTTKSGFKKLDGTSTSKTKIPLYSRIDKKH